MTLTKKFLLSASVVAGLSATLAVAPASAQTFSTSGPVTEYCSDGINTFFDGQGGMSCTDPLSVILSGNAAAPGGNLELNDETDDLTLTEFEAEGASTLTADFAGHEVIFSSLTFDDWFGVGGGGTDTSFGAENFANAWFMEGFDTYETAIRANPLLGLIPGLSSTSTKAEFFNAFRDGISVPGLGTLSGFQRFSDPNIAYVSKDFVDHKITFGLAGHLDAANLHPFFTGLTASEVVKVTHAGETNFFYTFEAPTDSGQVNKDGFSHNGNFEFMFEVGAKTPEPGTILGLMAVGGLAAAMRRKSSKQS